MKNPIVKEMVEASLKAGGFDGLFNVNGECGCCLDGLVPCSAISENCEAGYRYVREEDGGGGIRREKPDPKRTEAKCPYCGEWSGVVIVHKEGDLSRWRWKNRTNGHGCPECGAVVGVESECELREVEG
jgi:endogenous inhibitor of DNA gyrase (YacG/DUF329 family)